MIGNIHHNVTFREKLLKNPIPFRPELFLSDWITHTTGDLLNEVKEQKHRSEFQGIIVQNGSILNHLRIFQ